MCLTSSHEAGRAGQGRVSAIAQAFEALKPNKPSIPRPSFPKAAKLADSQAPATALQQQQQAPPAAAAPAAMIAAHRSGPVRGLSEDLMQQLRDGLHHQSRMQAPQAGPAAVSMPIPRQGSGSSKPGHVRGMTGIEEAMLKLEDQLHRLTREHSDLQLLDDTGTR